MNERFSSIRVDIYKPGKKGFFIFKRESTSTFPDESRLFSIGEVIGYGQFPDFGVFSVKETEEGIKLIMYTTGHIFLKDDEAEVFKKYEAGKDLEYPLTRNIVTLMSIKTQRQIVITLNPEQPNETPIGVKPQGPNPELSASVALEIPKQNP